MSERRLRAVHTQDSQSLPSSPGGRSEGDIEAIGRDVPNVDQLVERIRQLSDDIRHYMARSNAFGRFAVSGSRAKQKRYRKISSGCVMMIDELEHHASLMMRRGDY